MKKCIIVIIALIYIFLSVNLLFASTSLYGSFAGGGIWGWNGSSWSQVTPNNPDLMATAGANLYGAYPNGIWKWNGSSWSQVTPNEPVLMVTLGAYLYGSFAGGGIWGWNGSSWSQATPNTPTMMVATGSTLYGDFTGSGIWQWNGSTWSQVTPADPTIMAASGSTLYAAFAGWGILGYNCTSWTWVTPNTPTIMAVSGSTLYGYFTGSGIWQWNGSTWSHVTPTDPTIMAASGSTLYAAFAGAGIWQYNGTSWTWVTPNTPTIIAVTDLSQYINWTWVSGSNTINQFGSYGTKGVAAAGNVPGARTPSSISWTDSSGNLWLFGGWGYDSAGNLGSLNDLWKYDSTNWTWVSGSNTINQIGSYGTEGVAAAGNVPGARTNPVSWTDSSGNLWLFGGNGYDSEGSVVGFLNDLWKYDGTNWTWVSGSNTVNQIGSYGTEGVAAAGNVPGARRVSVSWTDSSGNLWLFGGNGYDSAGTVGFLNDLWKYNGTNWTWMSGSNTVNQIGTYGTKGVAAAGNVPGARKNSVSWTDSSGKLWLFGGEGYDSAGTVGFLNDLWKYNGTNWTWISGSNTVNQIGTYGTEGVAAAGNVPGARSNPVSWTDSSGNLWLFGGYGYDSANSGHLNDLWKYDGTNWTWVSGSNTRNQIGTYGTEGIAAAGNVPGGRDNPVSWTKSSGNLWLFGGWGYDSAGNSGFLNDLWRYQP